MSNQRVAAFLQDISLTHPHQYALVSAVRDLVLALGSDIVEEVKYGGILFGRETHFCGVFAYAQHVNVEFGDGASLHDMYSVLEGKGKLRRHIKLGQLGDLKQKHLLHYLRLADAQARG